ncbi:MAG: rRNA maturation RNase YbeY [Bacteroidia bacterium]|nr:rRNA maturation RNase YbeY [Bacteroidia bacterium]MCZ2277968.1 rRNA maturation RNase YbeY [Bacteroidia bacterium]
MSSINFYCTSAKPILRNKVLIRNWIEDTIRSENLKPGQISYIFISDQDLLKLNKKFLNHSDYTDIITFELSDKESELIDAEIYISFDRVKENAKIFHSGLETELHRVMIHGILHLCGYADKSKNQQTRMRELEDYYLQKLKSKLQ